MNKFYYAKSILGGILAGLVMFGLSKILFKDTLIGIIVLLGIFTFIFIIASIIGINRQMALVNKGDYEGAVNKFMEKHRYYENRYGYKGNYAIMAANCLNRMGKFQKSNESLAKVKIRSLDAHKQELYMKALCEFCSFLGYD